MPTEHRPEQFREAENVPVCPLLYRDCKCPHRLLPPREERQQRSELVDPMRVSPGEINEDAYAQPRPRRFVETDGPQHGQRLECETTPDVLLQPVDGSAYALRLAAESRVKQGCQLLCSARPDLARMVG